MLYYARMNEHLSPMKPRLLWVFLVVIFAIILIAPGELPCWLLDGGAGVHIHFYFGEKPIMGVPCPFSAMDATSSSAILEIHSSVDLLIAWLSKSTLQQNPQPVALIEKGWLPAPDFPPPRSPLPQS
jgi:hypothetical protein